MPTAHTSHRLRTAQFAKKSLSCSVAPRVCRYREPGQEKLLVAGGDGFHPRTSTPLSGAPCLCEYRFTYIRTRMRRATSVTSVETLAIKATGAKLSISEPSYKNQLRCPPQVSRDHLCCGLPVASVCIPKELDGQLQRAYRREGGCYIHTGISNSAYRAANKMHA